MIRPLRSMHRYVITMLAATLPATLAVIFLNHRPSSEAAKAYEPSSFAIKPVDISTDRRRLEVDAPVSQFPEVLVYWGPRDTTSVDTSSILLGRIEGVKTVLEIPAGLGNGEILFYSPPIAKLIAHLRLPEVTSP